MTKAEYEKFNKDVKDKYGNQLKPGDTVVFPDGYYHDCHIGKVHHFTDVNVIIIYRNNRWPNYDSKAQRRPDRIIKVRGLAKSTKKSK